MTTQRISFIKLDKIIKKTVDAINNSKNEIYDIAENAKKECMRLEDELTQLKQQVRDLIEATAKLEKELNDSKRKLLIANKNFSKYSEEELKQAYEKADSIRIELAVKREPEQFFIKRRNDLEVRIKDSYLTVQKADALIVNVGAALGYLTGDLKEISSQLENMQQRQLLGLRVIKAQEEERQRVAREIHDGPAQSKSYIIFLTS
jgi:two-component system sensor histidine kinase DegS